MKKKNYFLGLAAALFFTFSSPMTAKAVNYNYVTITVDAVDDSGGLQYAIDSDAPEAFSDSGSFQVEPGSTHTIYVKDSAGNMTSQVYSIPERAEKPEEPEQERQDGSIQADATVTESYDTETDQRKVNIDVNLANGAFTSPGAGAAEDGGGTLFDKQKTDGTDASGKIFYTVTTKEGEVFYLVVDQNRSDNNVYLLTQATVNDLQYLADQNDYNFTVAATGQNSQSLLNMLSGSSGGQSAEIQSSGNEKPKTTSETNSTLLVLILAVIGGGGYYFYKTKKNHREKQMDEIDAANDLQDYEIEEDEADEDVLEFGEVQEEQNESIEDEELNKFIALNVESVFGEEGEDKAVFGETISTKKEDLVTDEMRFEDYDEFGEGEE